MSTHHSTKGEASVRPRWFFTALLVVLLLAQLPVQFSFWRQIGAGHPVLWSVSLLAMLLTVAAVVGIIRQQTWALWAALCAMTWSATILLQSWSLGANRWALVGFAVVLGAYLVLMMVPALKWARPTPGVRLFYLAVASLTTYVAFWGLVFPKGTGWDLPFLADGFDGSLPFNIAVPTLHARVIGALYLAATLVCVLNIFSRGWREAWLGTWMILLWTGSILVVTLTHLDFFDWTKSSVWFWFVAYVGFPAIAAWVLKRQATEEDLPAGRPMPAAAKIYLVIQGVALLVLACVLQFSPTAAATIWPWAIIPLLSRFYSAPLVTFGVSSLMASRGKSWTEVRPLVCALTAMAAGSIVASCLHRDKFNFAGPAAWVWFSSLAVIGIASLVMAIASCWSMSRSEQNSP